MAACLYSPMAALATSAAPPQCSSPSPSAASPSTSRVHHWPAALKVASSPCPATSAPKRLRSHPPPAGALASASLPALRLPLRSAAAAAAAEDTAALRTPTAEHNSGMHIPFPPQRARSPKSGASSSAPTVFESPKAGCSSSVARSSPAPSTASARGGPSRTHLAHVLGQHRAERSGSSTSQSSSSAASVSSSLYSSACSSQEDDDPDEPPTAELDLGSLAAAGPLCAGGLLSPGVAPAYLVISVINHILFSRGALDMPLKLEPIFNLDDGRSAHPLHRPRTQSLGLNGPSGGSKGKGKQSKLIDTLKSLHVSLLEALNSLYADRSQPTQQDSISANDTCEALVSVLLSFGPSPLLPKEHLNIILRLTGVPKTTSSQGPASTKQATALDTAGLKQILKSMTTLQRKALRFVVSEDRLQPDAFQKKMANRMHVLLNIRRLPTASDPTAPTMNLRLLPGAGIASDESGAQSLPRGWSFRRNARVPSDVIRLQDRLSAPPVLPTTIEDYDSSADPLLAEAVEHVTGWNQGAAQAARPRSSSPSFAEGTEGSRGEEEEEPAVEGDQSFCTCPSTAPSSSASSSRLGSVSPSSSPSPSPTASPSRPGPASCGDATKRMAALGGGGSGGADGGAGDTSLPPSQTSSTSIGSSTPTALPFAPSPLRRDRAFSLLGNEEAGKDTADARRVNGEDEQEDGSRRRPRVGSLGRAAPPQQNQKRADPKTRLRGGFVLLRKTASTASALGASASSSSSSSAQQQCSHVHLQPHRRAPRSSAASSLSLSLSLPGFRNDEDASGAATALVGGPPVSGAGRPGNLRLPASRVSVASTASSSWQRKRRAPVVSLVLDLRSRSGEISDDEEKAAAATAAALRLSQAAGPSREAVAGKTEDEEEEAQWWICDTVIPLGR